MGRERYEDNTPECKKTFRELMFESVRESKPSDVTGYGWPGAVVRWCTGQLKTRIIHNFTKDLPYTPYHYIAFAADEKKRLKRKNNQNPMYRYPLIKWGVTETEALAGCYAAGYTWDGLYKHFSRVSCWCCPLQSLKDLRTLRIHYPDIWALLRELDDQAITQFGRDSPYGQFRPKESVRMLEVRFDFEREWAQAGGNIRSKVFYQALRHTFNEWVRRKDGTWEISNQTYIMTFKIWEDTEKPGTFLVSWAIGVNRPQQPKTEKYYYSGAPSIAEQTKKRYDTPKAAQKYIQGRFDLYSHLFTELRPPIPDGFQRAFTINGCLLPEYTVSPPKRTSSKDIDDLLDFLEDKDIFPSEQKEPSAPAPEKVSRPAAQKKTNQKKPAPIR